MKLPRSILYLFVIIMGICTLIFIWQVPESSSMSYKLSEARLSLETAQGRERKQQAEYDKALQSIEEARVQLEAITPQHDEVVAAKEAQVAERKELKTRREELKAQIEALLLEETAGEEAAQ